MQITAAAAVLYNACLSLAAAGGDSDDLLMEIGSAAAQSLANGQSRALCTPSRSKHPLFSLVSVSNRS
jgi:hypothetical protein